MICSSRSCSSSVSVSFSVEPRLWDSTTRQQTPRRRIASDSSASRVQVVDDIDKAAHGLDALHRFGMKRGVVVFEPGSRDGIVATDDCRQRAVHANEQHGELVRLLRGAENVGALLHARDGGVGQADDGAKRRVGELQIVRRVQQRLGDDRRLGGGFAGGGSGLHGPSGRQFLWKYYTIFLSEERRDLNPFVARVAGCREYRR